MKKLILLAIVISFVLGGQGYAEAQSTKINSVVPKCEPKKMWAAMKKNKAKKLVAFLNERPEYDVDCVDGTFVKAPLLLSAINNGLHNIVPILIKQGADVNYRTNTGRTPAMYSASLSGILHRHTLPMLIALQNAGADIHAVDNAGYNIISLSIATNNEELFSYAQDNGVDLFNKDVNGSSNRDIVEALIDDNHIARRSKINLTLVENNVPKSKVFSGIQIVKNSGQTKKISKVHEPKKNTSSSGLSRFLNSIIIKSEGTGRKCHHVIVIGNFTGYRLNGQFWAKLENGNHQEKGDRSGGRFVLPAGGTIKHDIWLSQGGNQMLGLSAGGQSARADVFNFLVPSDCNDGKKALTLRTFVAENDNRTGRISIFEDKNGDGRRDEVATNPTPSNDGQCARLDKLAVKIGENSQIAYSDKQLEDLFTAVGCQLDTDTLSQRNQIKSLLAK